jgi:cytochrome c oxidase assembly protein subunit 15
MGKIVALMSNLEPLNPAPTQSDAPFRFAKATLGATCVLLLFGGLVTTIGAGMDVAGWLDAEGHFMPFFPFAKWFRDFGTFAEHTHRMVGILVGFLSIAMVVATFRKDNRRAAKAMVLLALFAVIAQGYLGGSRVLENSESLAFLHGAAAQAVFAILWCTTLYLMGSFRRGGDINPNAANRLRGVGRGVALVIYGQILMGAWFRHSIRHATTVPSSGEALFPMAAFISHAMGAVVVAGAVLVLAKQVRNAWESSEDEVIRKVLRRQEYWLHFCFGMQFILGLGSLATLSMERDAIPVVVLTTLHVLFGALLLSAAAASSFWGARLATPAAGATSSANPTSEPA